MYEFQMKYDFCLYLFALFSDKIGAYKKAIQDEKERLLWDLQMN